MSAPALAATHSFSALGRSGYITVAFFDGRPRQIYVTVAGVELHVARWIDDIAQAMALMLYRGWTIGGLVRQREHPLAFGGHSELMDAVVGEIEAWFAAGMPDDRGDAS